VGDTVHVESVRLDDLGGLSGKKEKKYSNLQSFPVWTCPKQATRKMIGNTHKHLPPLPYHVISDSLLRPQPSLRGAVLKLLALPLMIIDSNSNMVRIGQPSSSATQLIALSR
jgi:hypothetical protein